MDVIKFVCLTFFFTGIQVGVSKRSDELRVRRNDSIDDSVSSNGIGLGYKIDSTSENSACPSVDGVVWLPSSAEFELVGALFAIRVSIIVQSTSVRLINDLTKYAAHQVQSMITILVL